MQGVATLHTARTDCLGLLYQTLQAIVTSHSFLKLTIPCSLELDRVITSYGISDQSLCCNSEKELWNPNKEDLSRRYQARVSFDSNAGNQCHVY